MTPKELNEVHRHSIHNKEKIESSKLVGCFHCLKIFTPQEITEWVDHDSDTAICPHCGIDSVLPDKEIKDLSIEFLERIEHHWFRRDDK